MKEPKIKKVTIEYEDRTLIVEGKEAKKWNQHNVSVAFTAQMHGCNPFKNDPIKWKVIEHEPNPT